MSIQLFSKNPLYLYYRLVMACNRVLLNYNNFIWIIYKQTLMYNCQSQQFLSLKTAHSYYYPYFYDKLLSLLIPEIKSFIFNLNFQFSTLKYIIILWLNMLTKHKYNTITHSICRRHQFHEACQSTYEC